MRHTPCSPGAQRLGGDMNTNVNYYIVWCDNHSEKVIVRESQRKHKETIFHFIHEGREIFWMW